MRWNMRRAWRLRHLRTLQLAGIQSLLLNWLGWAGLRLKRINERTNEQTIEFHRPGDARSPRPRRPCRAAVLVAGRN